MKLLKARVLGFQSFSDSGDVEFADGINLLVGQNNAGKSSLLRALQPALADDRHRTPQKWEDFRLPQPRVELTIDISGSELRSTILRRGQSFIPLPSGENAELYTNALLGQAQIPINIIHLPGRGFSASYPGHGRFVYRGTEQKYCAMAAPHDGELQFVEQHRDEDSIALLVHDIWQREMFYFSAERMNIGQSAPGYVQRLSSNADNLPAVLLTLSGDRGNLFQKLVRHLREVFPTVGNVSVRPLSGSTIEIRVWPTDSMERVELSFPLMQCGTGVSQVMAILAAVMTVENAVLIIDEINSFLHPAAVKALLRILQTEYAHHQYIISTHAPDVIGFSNPRTIHLIKREGYESSIANLDLEKVAAFREVAEHLGVSMTDVFAADRVIWVEGPTEELCFPLIYQQAVGRPLPRGTVFTSVMATGDFMARRRDKELVYQIYQRLSQVAVPLVISVAFSFDSENLSEAEKEKMVRDSRGAMHFLPRRHMECYLINPRAIAEFLAQKDPDSAGVVNADTVMQKLSELADTDKFRVVEWRGDLADTAWQTKVDAANLIAEAIAQLSESRANFNKKDDTLALLQRVQVEDQNLYELAQYVQALVAAVNLGSLSP